MGLTSVGDAVDGALDEGAVDGARVINLEAIDLAGAEAIGEFQLMGGGIDDGQHSSA